MYQLAGSGTHTSDVVQIEVDPQTQYFYAAPLPLSPRFTGQEIYLKQLREYFQPQIDRTNGRRSFLLCGMGGVGKTQIALKFAEESAEKCASSFSWLNITDSIF